MNRIERINNIEKKVKKGRKVSKEKNMENNCEKKKKRKGNKYRKKEMYIHVELSTKSKITKSWGIISASG